MTNQFRASAHREPAHKTLPTKWERITVPAADSRIAHTGTATRLDASVFDRASERRAIEQASLALPLDRAALARVERAAAERLAIITEFGLLTSRDVAEFAHSEARNRAATAHRWLSAGRIFTVVTGQGDLYPTFQFADGTPKPVMAEIIAAVDGNSGKASGEHTLTGWPLALWFVAPNAHLDGARPVDVLDETPGDVVEAARESVRQTVTA